MIHPLNSAPEPKRRFVPSKWEHEKIMKIVRAIRHGLIKIDEEKKEEPEQFDLWGTPAEPLARRADHIPAPRVQLPGHAESYNPPAEYLFSESELQKWKDTDPADRKLDFIPKKYASLRDVPGYSRLVYEKFTRCLDLYLCPRARRMKVCCLFRPLVTCR
jgi:ribosome biogenesis protein ERB1